MDVPEVTAEICVARWHRAVALLIGAFAAASPATGAEALSPQTCPQQGELRAPATGRVGGATVTAANAGSCWQPLNENVTLLWPYESNDMAADAMAQAVQSSIPWIRSAYSSYLELFGTSPASITSRNGAGSIIVGLYPEIRTSGGTLGGFHRYEAADKRSVVYISLDARAVSAGSGTPWAQMRPHTIAHEMFHAFHYQTRRSGFETPYRWLTEALADWAAKRVTDAAPIYTVAGEYIYHRAMGRFFEQVGSGLLSMQYPAHLFLHDQAAQHGDDRIKAILAAHLLGGRNADALGAADVRSNWHEFSKQLLNRPPWQRLQDKPQLPPDWELGASHRLDVASDTYCSDPARMTMPPLSAQRVTIQLPARPEQLYLQVTSSGRDRSGLEWSAALYPSGQPYELATDAASLLCFSDAQPSCHGAPALPATDRIELILSNHNLDRTMRPRLQVCTLPSEMRGGTSRVESIHTSSPRRKR